MKKAKWPLLLLTPLALFSCGDAPIDFPYSDDPDRLYLNRNGDTLGLSGPSHPYDEALRDGMKEDFITDIALGRQFAIFLHQDGCSSCDAAHDNLVSFFLASHVEIYGLHIERNQPAPYVQKLNEIASAYPKLSVTFTGSYVTPSLFFVRSESVAQVSDFYSQKDSVANLASFFKEEINFTSIYDFETLAGFDRFEGSNALLYVDPLLDETSARYYTDVHQIAIHSSKPTSHVLTSSWTEEDRGELYRRYGVNEAGAIVDIENGQIKKVSPIDDTSIIESYYA